MSFFTGIADEREATPFPTAIAHHRDGDRVVFSWSTEDPPLRGCYRIEWKFKVPDDEASV